MKSILRQLFRFLSPIPVVKIAKDVSFIVMLPIVISLIVIQVLTMDSRQKIRTIKNLFSSVQISEIDLAQN